MPIVFCPPGLWFHNLFVRSVQNSTARIMMGGKSSSTHPGSMTPGCVVVFLSFYIQHSTTCSPALVDMGKTAAMDRGYPHAFDSLFFIESI